MKKIKIVAIVSGALTVLQLVPYISNIALIVTLKLTLKSDSIIGSADGPTSIVVVDDLYMLFALARHVFFFLCAITFIVSMILYFKKKKQSRND